MHINSDAPKFNGSSAYFIISTWCVNSFNKKTLLNNRLLRIEEKIDVRLD